MTLTSHASTLEFSIIPSLVLCFKSFSDDHGGFCVLVDLHSEVQGCTTVRCLHQKSHRDLDSHRDKSCSTLSSTKSA